MAKNYLMKTRDFIKNHYIISGVIFLGLVVVVYFAFKNSNGKTDLYTVKYGDVIQKVVVSGKTKPVDKVDLGFENSGKVASVYVDVGTRVYSGQTLLSLDQSNTYADLLKAQANLETEQAKLDELNKGTRPEEIAIAEVNVSSAEVALNDSLQNLEQKIMEAYTKSDDAIHNNVDQFFSNPRTNNPQLNLTTYDYQTKNDINLNRYAIEGVLENWKNKTSSNDLALAKTSLNQIKSFIDSVSVVVNSQTTSYGVSQTTIDGYKTSISSARTSVSGAISALTSAEEKLNTAKATLLNAQNTLSLKKNGNTPEVIRAQEARVLQMKAQVQSVEAQLSKMTLRSPLNGVVTAMESKVGEIVTPGKIVVSIISDSNLELEANVSEINIGKVNVGNPVDITMDAFPGKTFVGNVTYIEPAETLVDGVVNYKVTIAFAEKYPEIKSGLTANLDIKTSVKNNVLRVPEYYLIREGDKVSVSKQEKNKFSIVPVQVGLVGGDGFIEVLSGLKEGDVISMVVSEKTE